VVEGHDRAAAHGRRNHRAFDAGRAAAAAGIARRRAVGVDFQLRSFRRRAGRLPISPRRNLALAAFGRGG